MPSNEGHEVNKVPRYAIWKGQRVRVLYYDSSSSRPFRILCRGDEQRSVAREDLTFLPGKKG